MTHARGSFRARAARTGCNNYRSGAILTRRLARSLRWHRQRRCSQRRVERRGERRLAAHQFEPSDLESFAPSLARKDEAFAGERQRVRFVADRELALQRTFEFRRHRVDLATRRFASRAERQPVSRSFLLVKYAVLTKNCCSCSTVS